MESGVSGVTNVLMGMLSAGVGLRNIEVFVIAKVCETCKHKGTMGCLNSSLCYALEYKPYWEKK